MPLSNHDPENDLGQERSNLIDVKGHFERYTPESARLRLLVEVHFMDKPNTCFIRHLQYAEQL